jgi:hypothetical protein
MKGASRSTISDLYRKKYKSELPEITFFRWKMEAKSLVEVKSNHRCVQSWKKSTSMEKFEDMIKEEYRIFYFINSNNLIVWLLI